MMPVEHVLHLVLTFQTGGVVVLAGVNAASGASDAIAVPLARLQTAPVPDVMSAGVSILAERLGAPMSDEQAEAFGVRMADQIAVEMAKGLNAGRQVETC